MFKKISPLFQTIVKNDLSKRNLNIGVLGVPFGKGQRKYGVEDAPKFLRDYGLLTRLKELGSLVDVKDYGDVVYNVEDCKGSAYNMNCYGDVMACNRELSRSVQKVINDNRICLTIGGDHSIAIGSVDGHLHSKSDNVAVLWVDAHADINVNKVSKSGNIHGMPLALLAKELVNEWNQLPGTEWMKRSLSLKHLAYIGLRSVDDAEKILIKKHKILAYGMQDVDNYGVKELIKIALNQIDPEQNKSIHVSFDIDSLDVLEAPSTTCPVRGGLSLREAFKIMELLHETGRLNAIDLVEVNPRIGTSTDINTTISAAIELILAAFGDRNSLRMTKL